MGIPAQQVAWQMRVPAAVFLILLATHGLMALPAVKESNDLFGSAFLENLRKSADGGDQSIEHATALANMMADEIEKSATSSSVKKDAGIKIAPASIADEAPIDYSELDEDA